MKRNDIFRNQSSIIESVSVKVLSSFKYSERIVIGILLGASSSEMPSGEIR